MTVINHTYGFVFIHIPKNAGTSVVAALSPFNTYRDLEVGASDLGEALRLQYARRFGISKHATVAEVRAAMGEDWHRYRSFAVVRDPLQRVASIFGFLKQWRGWRDMPTMRPHLDEFDGCRTLDQFVSSQFFTTPGPDRIFEPQARWVTEGGRVSVDALLHVDRLAVDLAGFLRPLGVPVQGLDLKRLNPSGSRGLPGLSAAAQQRVRDRYGADFPLVGTITGPAHVDSPPIGERRSRLG